MSELNVQVINRIAELAVNAESKFETHEINGELYVNQNLTKVKPETCSCIRLTSLCALIDFVRATVEKSKEQFSMPLMIFSSYDTINVRSSLDKNMDRDTLAEVNPTLPHISFNSWMSMEEFIIQLQTCFVDTPNKMALIELVSNLTDETKVTMTDDGMGQKMTVSKGSSLKQEVVMQPIVRIVPYRTYKEVDQVETMYLIRAREGGELKIIEADGGSWKMEAQHRVSDFLHEELKDLIESKDVVVIG